MSVKPKLYLNLFWHMHQPDYRDVLTCEFVLPWTYLHAIKDYTDMAHHLEANPAACATFNFVPVLLDQLEDYTRQFAEGKIRDPLLALLAVDNLDQITATQRQLIIESCFRSNHRKMLAPFTHYQRLLDVFKALVSLEDGSLDYLSGRYLADLLVWYHLAWTGESVRRSSALVKGLIEKGHGYNLQDRQALFKLIGKLIAELIPRYKKLQESGRIEISTTPHYHPILPLLLDFDCVRDAMPDAPLPVYPQYPGGTSRAKAHIESAQKSHLRRFGQAASGMWPAEGGVSHAGFILMAAHGVSWAASGEGVLANSLHKQSGEESLPPRQEYLYKPYRIADSKHEIIGFFRDDNLSDKIGFDYAKWLATDAVKDFVAELEHIHKNSNPEEHAVVSVILDGENAWEYYPYNGYYFLSELYEALAGHPHIELTTFSEITGRLKTEPPKKSKKIGLGTLSTISAGSWVYGSFSTWIGSADKNRGWDLLCEAKKSYDQIMQEGILNKAEIAAAERQLSVCEGSDWFWWLGDYNPSHSVESFDRLYRRNLANLYRLLKLPTPDALNQPISKGRGDPATGGTMRRGSEV
jgi:alpha-amylase/alpha-mannosidase (GH57 family)